MQFSIGERIQKCEIVAESKVWEAEMCDIVTLLNALLTNSIFHMQPAEGRRVRKVK